MPRRPWPIWLSAVLVVSGLPLVSLVYYRALLRSGTLPPDGDTIAIPIYGSMFAALILAAPVMLGTFACVRNYRPGGRLLAWRRDRPVLSAAVSGLFGAPAVFLALGIGETVVYRDPLIEYIWLPYFALCVVWLLWLRAAALGPRTGGG